MTAPEDLPRAADNSLTVETWAEGGVAVEPPPLAKNTGWTFAQTIDESLFNWPLREAL